MTGVTTWNKSVTPAGADGWNMTTDVRKAIETLNTPVPVASQAERDALTPPTGKYAGMQVLRTDLPGCLVETWDGVEWAGAVRHVEYTFPNASTPNNTAWGPGVGTVSTARSLYPSFVSQPTNDQFTVTKTGVYAISWYMNWGGIQGPCFFALSRGGSHVTGQQYPSAYEHTHSFANMYLAAGETLQLTFVQTSGVSIQPTHRVFITKLG